ncbi:MAG: response regulator [Nitrospirae bacterium]|jgi:DNA-binding NtrC family response regulator|nr:response regulator [Nitrospirota bacterium]MDA8214434.1 response regulator [Nitrospiraceae bacterium]
MEKGRILVIDDEEIVRLSCKRTLVPEGYEVDTAASGKEGMELFEKSKYDLVLIDLKMPGIDGIEVLVNIKRQHPEQNVMIMTGYDTIEHIVESISSGAAHYLEKPFTPDTLIERINEVLGQRI